MESFLSLYLDSSPNLSMGPWGGETPERGGGGGGSEQVSERVGGWVVE